MQERVFPLLGFWHMLFEPNTHKTSKKVIASEQALLEFKKHFEAACGDSKTAEVFNLRNLNLTLVVMTIAT
jgi:hypothetical protein